MIHLALRFHKQKSENRYLRPVLHICCWYICSSWYTYSCCPRVTISTSGKAKTGIPAALYGTSVSKPAAARTIPFSRPAGTPAAVALALWFSRPKNRKQVPATGLTHLLPPHYDFYDRKSKNRYVRSAWHTCSCCPRVRNRKSKNG